MFPRSRISFAALSLFAFTACSNSGATSGFAPRAAGLDSSSLETIAVPAKNGAARLFVADAANVVVAIYDAKGTRIGQIVGTAGSLATDAAGNLYVANLAGNGAIEIFTQPYNGKPRVLSGTGTAIAVDASSGLVGVAGVGSPGAIAFYKKGETRPCTTLNASARIEFLAFDAAGDLFFDGQNSKGTIAIGEIAGGCAAKSFVPLTIANSIGFPGGVAVAANGDVAIGDQSNATIFTYARPKNGSLGAPLRTTTFSASDATAFVFADRGRTFWEADAGLGNASEFTYPKGGTPIATRDTGGQPIGIAVIPAVVP